MSERDEFIEVRVRPQDVELTSKVDEEFATLRFRPSSVGGRSRIPVLDKHSRDIADVVGKFDVPVDLGKMLADGLVRLDPCYTKKPDGTVELIEVSFVPNFFPHEEEVLQAFFKEVRGLCKDELNEGDSVLPVILAKLKLLEAAKEMKLGIPYLTAKGYIEFAKARFELDEQEVEALRSVIQAAHERKVKAKMQGGNS